MVDEESGTPNFQHEGSPSNTLLPKTPISMCGHQAQGRKSATKSSVQKKIKKSKKCLFFIYVRSCTWCVHIPLLVINGSYWPICAQKNLERVAGNFWRLTAHFQNFRISDYSISNAEGSREGDFLQNFRSPQILDGRSGTPTIFLEGSPGNT